MFPRGWQNKGSSVLQQYSKQMVFLVKGPDPSLKQICAYEYIRSVCLVSLVHDSEVAT
jgi:hypothetical protein